MSALCRECGALAAAPVGVRPLRRLRLAAPGRASPSSTTLSIAHIDCDAFYATVEKRDRPELADQPVIVGGGQRGVVLACCYVARLYGVRSAMPMFKALAACPNAVVIRPDMAKYREVGRAVRAEMRRLTPLVEPLSIDEAFLDLTRHRADAPHGAGAGAGRAGARGSRRRSASPSSIGLSYNKFLAKIASDLDKPRGFAVIGRGDAAAFLADKPVGLTLGRRRGDATPARRRRNRADRPAARARRTRDGASLRQNGAASRSPRPRRGFAPSRSDIAGEVDLGRDHLRA